MVTDVFIKINPIVVVIAISLIGWESWRARRFWSSLFTLRRGDVASGPELAGLFLCVAVILYLLQGTSPNASSVRYLLPVWIALPGLFACGLHALPPRIRPFAVSGLLVPWALAHLLIASDLDRPSPARPLVEVLTRHGVTGIVAPTPVALIVANLSHGHIGASEYQPIWPRLGSRYNDRFPAGQPVVCVTDRHFRSGQSEVADFEGQLKRLAARRPARVRRVNEVGSFEIWEVDLPLVEILTPEPDVGR